MPPINVMLKPASGLCNMHCQYCFYRDLQENRKTSNIGMMSLQTVETVIRRVFATAEVFCGFAFQGGEPTLCGLEFYREFCDMAERFNTKNTKINWSLQTNGLLIDEEWAYFLQEKKFLVGISLDGPADLHNGARVDKSGKGTYTRVLHAADLLRKYKVEFNILCVVTNQNARRGKQVYDFFKNHGFNFLQFIPCLHPLGGESIYGLTPRRYGEFLNTVFDAWYLDIKKNKYISIRNIDNYIWMLAGAEPELCSMRGQCNCQFIIDADGDVYPCDFYTLDKWHLGNVETDSFQKMFESETAKHFIIESLTRESCQGCNWFPLCRGGCQRDYIADGGRNYNLFCESYKIFFEHCYTRMREIAIFMPRI